MHFTTASEYSARTKWQQAARVVLTIGLLSTVAVVGFFLLGSEVLAAWTAPSNSEPQLASAGALAGLVNFEAPAATVARLETTTQEAVKSSGQANNTPLLAKNWKYTQNTTADAFQLSYTAYFQGLFILGLEGYFDSLPLSPSTQTFIDQVFGAYYQLDIVAQAFANSLLPAAFRSPPLPPASPTL